MCNNLHACERKCIQKQIVCWIIHLEEIHLWIFRDGWFKETQAKKAKEREGRNKMRNVVEELMDDEMGREILIETPVLV